MALLTKQQVDNTEKLYNEDDHYALNENRINGDPQESRLYDQGRHEWENHWNINGWGPELTSKQNEAPEQPNKEMDALKPSANFAKNIDKQELEPSISGEEIKQKLYNLIIHLRDKEDCKEQQGIDSVQSFLFSNNIFKEYLKDKNQHQLVTFLRGIATDSNVEITSAGIKYFGTLVTPEAILDKLIIHFIPINKLPEEGRIIAQENNPPVAIAVPGWENQLFDIVHRCITERINNGSKLDSTALSSDADAGKLNVILSALRTTEVGTSNYFATATLKDMRRFIIKIANDEHGTVKGNDLIVFDKKEVDRNSFFKSVALQFVPAPELNLSSSAIDDLLENTTLREKGMFDEVKQDLKNFFSRRGKSDQGKCSSSKQL